METKKNLNFGYTVAIISLTNTKESLYFDRLV